MMGFTRSFGSMYWALVISDDVCPEYVSRQVGTTGPVNDGGHGASERMWRHTCDACLLQVCPQPAPHIARGQRRVVARTEQQLLRLLSRDGHQPLPIGLGRE